MTKIHPEADSILNQHGIETHATYGFHYVLYPEANRAVSQALFERDEARKSRDLAWAEKEHEADVLRSSIHNLSDERDDLRAQVAEMREALTAVEQWWLDMGMRHLDGAPTAIYRVREILSKDNSND